MSFNFTPATPDEGIVYGARRPCHPRLGPPDESIADWISFVESQGVKRICCLLDSRHLQEYDNLLRTYRTTFGENRVCHAPIPDFSTVDRTTFCHQILPFLDDADESDEPVVVHCSAGSGRTGHVLTLWINARREYELREAVRAVRETGRKPLEATTLEQLNRIQCDK